MNERKGAAPIPQAVQDRIAGLEADLDDALATMDWQRGTISRLKAVFALAQDERRAPTEAEVTAALHDGTHVRAAA